MVIVYRAVCLILFVVVMGYLAHLARDFGEWSTGFAGGLGVGVTGASLISIAGERPNYLPRQILLAAVIAVGALGLSIFLFIDSPHRGEWLTGFLIAALGAAFIAPWAIKAERRETTASGKRLIDGRWRE